MTRVIRAGLAGLGLLALAAGAAAAGAEPFLVKRVSVEDRKAVFATVESVDVVSARARIGGTVTRLEVDEGARVEQGRPIARIEDPKLPIRVAAIDARIQSLNAQRDLAHTALDRARSLRESGAASQARLDEARTALDVAERELAAMRAERNVIVEQRAEGDVLAPRTGRVLKVNVTEGAVMMAGESVAEIAAERYVLRLSLPERHARFIRVGDVVTVGPRGMDPAAEGAGRAGRVRQVYPRIDQGRVSADVEVEGLGDFFVGERARVSVAAGARETFAIPADHVFERLGVSFVRLASGVEVVVQPGPETGPGMVEILSGLREGDAIVPPVGR